MSEEAVFQGSEATPGEAEAGQGEAQQAESNANPFEDRIRNDPAFAVEQVKKFQSQAHRAESEKKQVLDRLGRVAPLMETLGNDSEAVMSEITEYAAVKSNPAMQQIIAEFRKTGRLPTEQVNDDPYSGYEEPENGQLAEMRQQMTALVEQINGLQSGLSDTRVNSSKQVIVDYLSEIESKYDEHQYQTILKPRIQSQLEIWQSDPQGRKTLETLNRRTLELIEADIIRENFGEFAKSYVAKSQRQLQNTSTGNPPGVTTTPASTPKEGKLLSVQDAFDEADRRARNGTLDKKYNYIQGFGGGQE